MSDAISTGVMLLSFLLSLALTGVLWWNTSRSPVTRRFWGLLALAFTLNLVADIGWGIYSALGGAGQPEWTDALYLLRYLSILTALILHPSARSPRERGIWLGWLGTMLLSALVLWLTLARPAWGTTTEPAVDIVAGMVYPVLDAGLLFVALIRWREEPTGRLGRATAWFTLAFLAYGVANWINYGVGVASPDAETILPALFWLLSTVLAGVAGWGWLKQDRRER